MKLKKVTKDYDMVYTKTDNIDTSKNYIPIEVIEKDKSVEDAVMLFYLIQEKNDEGYYRCAGKAIVRKSDIPYNANSINAFRPKNANILSSSSIPTYKYNLSLLDSTLPYNVKSTFCAKITQIIMNTYGSHLYLFFNGDDNVKQIAKDVGYRQVDKNIAMFQQDDLAAISNVASAI